MSDLLAQDLAWWAWGLMITGGLALVGVIGALFLPDWPTPDYGAD